MKNHDSTSPLSLGDVVG